MNSRKSDPKFLRAYDRGMLRSAFVSLFWGIITGLKERQGFTLVALAKTLGTNKGEVSRWFNGDPNWTVNTIANIANALNVDLYIYAVDRTSGAIYTSSGAQTQTRFQGISSITKPLLSTRPPVFTSGFLVPPPPSGFPRADVGRIAA